MYVGLAVVVASVAAFLVRFSAEAVTDERRRLVEALLERQSIQAATSAVSFHPALRPVRAGMPYVAEEDLYVVSKYTGFNRFSREFRSR